MSECRFLNDVFTSMSECRFVNDVLTSVSECRFVNDVFTSLSECRFVNDVISNDPFSSKIWLSSSLGLLKIVRVNCVVLSFETHC